MKVKDHINVPKKHVEAVHGGKKPYQCTICERQFARQTSLNLHFELGA